MNAQTTHEGSDRGALLAAAVDAVCRAALVTQWVRAQSGGRDVGRISKADGSAVTIADLAAQAVIVRALAALPPPAGLWAVVGEESAAYLRDPANSADLRAALDALDRSGAWPDARADDLLAAIDAGAVRSASPASLNARSAGLPQTFWTTDPIDGTKGYVRGRHYAVCLALVEQGRPTVAAIACPSLSLDRAHPLTEPDPVGSVYATQVGGPVLEAALPAAGARAALAAIPRPAYNLDRPSLTYSVEPNETRAEGFAAVCERLASTRPPAQLDSQCKYAVVARGQADCYFRPPRGPGENIWDHAPGILLVESAGCLATGIDGEPLWFGSEKMTQSRGIVAAPAALNARVRAAFHAAVAPRR